ncbi:Vitamin B12 import ATP-binding protein BtuD [Candidatus Lokiarchaeum ossiferum]|uniref:Vitamin B12 import ATP-binding protein BtuD n=1 Tax=Candidatus Lokiarchaeum ossiferum TaxID=2951803 RepID=A0ABY6HUK9_9ARCH|nr:Vitamin B12 import ATP-binding protein BtuD [Candidatus Lokiarchaeum sp. B-35]
MRKEQDYSDRELFNKFLHFLNPFKKQLGLIALFIFLRMLTELINPILVRYVSDHILLENQNTFLIILSGVTYLGCSLINWWSFSSHRRQLGHFVPHFLENLRLDVFDAVQSQDMTFFDENLSGKINSIVVNDTVDFSNIAILISDTIGNLFISIITFLILLWFNSTLALIVLLAIPVLFLLTFALRKLAKKVSITFRRSIGNVNAAMVESIEGIHISKNYGQEMQVSQQFDVVNHEYFNSWFRLTSVTHFWRPLLNTLSSVILCIVLYFGALKVIDQEVSPGTMILFVLYLQTFFRPIMIIARFFPELSTGMAAFQRIVRILERKPKVQQNLKSKKVANLRGDIQFDNVNFSYIPDQPVIENLNLNIKNGEKIAIVGHTGAGKTTIGALLSRFYEYQEGTITIDRRNLRDIDISSIRKRIAKVEQNIFLFPGSIEENIRYGNLSATKEEVQNAIRIAHAEEFIDYLPEGLKTYVGERGGELSMGQRQLISFARAILMDPDILILDEATASVDAYTEALIQDALERVLQNRTAIIIAHRLSTVIKADRIVVLDHGKIIEQGTHKNLLALEGKYASLYHKYFEYQQF